MALTMHALHSINRQPFQVRFVEGREGIRDRTRAIEETIRILETRSFYTDEAETELCHDRVRAKQEALPLITEAKRLAKMMADDGGHRFDEDYFNIHKHYGIATVIVHPLLSTTGTGAEFGATAAMLHLYPPDVEGQRPVLCKTTEEIGELLQLIRPDVAPEDHGSETIWGYMGQFKDHGTDVLLLVADTLLGHAWDAAVFEALGEQALYMDTATCFKAKLCGGGGRSRSQHKLSLAKFRMLFAPDLLARFAGVFFAPQRRGKRTAGNDTPAARKKHRQEDIVAEDNLEASAGEILGIVYQTLRKALSECNRDDAIVAYELMVNAERIFGEEVLADVMDDHISKGAEAMVMLLKFPAIMSRRLRKFTQREERAAKYSEFCRVAGLEEHTFQ